MSAAGTAPVRLNNNTASETSPAWSPDGTKLVFSSLREISPTFPDGGNYDIYVMNADGTSLVRLTNFPGNELQPTWSPDGSKIAFVADGDGGLSQIYSMNANGTNRVRLTGALHEDVSPSWSPDGTKIVFSSTRDGNPELYVMNADGTNPVRLTTDPDPAGFVHEDIDPAW
jgi:Tol biopolymer transport system component